MRSGAHPFPLILSIVASIMDNGLMMRPIGRFWIDASPVSSDVKSCPARIPEISLVVVPLFPTSRISVGQ